MIDTGLRPPPPTATTRHEAVQLVTVPNTLAKGTPSIAQYAINQISNKHAKISEDSQRTPPAVGKSLSIFKDTESGRYVTMYRDPTKGTVEQIPDERTLEFYARISVDLDKILNPKESNIDVET
jgi:uncharacterized FlaG/YvyC family protein